MPGSDPADIALGTLLRARRLAAGLTQERLGTLCGINFTQIQKYENGINRVSFSRLFQLAGYLQTSVTALVSEVERNLTRDGELGEAVIVSPPGEQADEDGRHIDEDIAAGNTSILDKKSPPETMNDARMGDLRTRKGRLTPRELDCLAAIARGLTAAEAGRVLGLSETTVRSHLMKSRRRFAAASAAELVAKALSTGELTARRVWPQTPDGEQAGEGEEALLHRACTRA